MSFNVQSDLEIPIRTAKSVGVNPPGDTVGYLTACYLVLQLFGVERSDNLQRD